MRAVRGRKTSRRFIAIGLLVTAVIIGVAACTSGSVTESRDSTSAASAEPQRNAINAAPEVAGSAAANSAAVGSAAAGASAPGAAPDAGTADQSTGSSGQSVLAPVDGSKIIKTGDLTVRLVVEPVKATDDQQADREANAAARAAAAGQAGASARGIAAAAGGFQSSADGGGSSLSMSLRVPAEQYEAVVDSLAALGELTNRTETSQDVTAQVADVNSRVDSMTASVGRVRALLASATDISDVISIESELAEREANLESLQQQQAALSGQVAMSTVSLSLTAVTKDAVEPEPVVTDSGFLAGLKSGWAALTGFLGGFAGVLGVVLPFVPLIATVGLLVWWLIRRARRPAQDPTG